MATTCDINNKTPKISYPTHWQYKLIIQKKDDIKTIADTVLAGKEYTLEPSKKSKKGTYSSFDLQTLVTSEDERKALFDKFKAHPSIKFVL